MASTTGLGTLWIGYGSNSNPISSQTGTNSSVAALALESVGLSAGSSSIGGSLGSLDIKRMDVKTAISMSFMEEFVNTGKLYEVVADTSGGIDIVEVGQSGGSLSPIYYSVQTFSYTNKITDVLITGGKPLPEIKIGAFYDVLSTKYVFTQQTMLENCRLPDFYKYATIIYKDPHLDNSNYNDGIDNLYNVTNPFEKIIGYVHYKDTPLKGRADVKVDWSNTSAVPILVAAGGGSIESPPNIDIGTVQELQNYKVTGYGENFCYSGGTGTTVVGGGISIPIPPDLRYSTVRGVQQDGLIRVSAVYLIGLTIDFLFFAPNDYEFVNAAPSAGNSTLWASINRKVFNTFKCEEGKHYAISMQNGEPQIVFAKSTRTGDPFAYGAGTSFRVDPFCSLGVTKGGELITGTVLPVTKSSGMLIFEIWATIDIEMPSINIYDPQGQAHTYVDGFVYNIAPITAIDKPTPVASAVYGLIDQAVSVQNADPTDVQDFSSTPMDEALDNMQGGGQSVTWSFLDEGGVALAATRLKGLLDSQSNVETVYTCGPNADPELCASYADGYINAIRYSYTDQGSYTISVTVGPYIVNSSIVSVDGGPTPMMTENVSAKGTIIQSAGDNINFKVSINGYGERWAICMTPSILRVGDIVQCSVHNNPVEY